MNKVHAMQLVKQFESMTLDDYAMVISAKGFAIPEDEARLEYLAKYIMQTESKGFSGKQLYQIADDAVNRLFSMMPHLATKYNQKEIIMTATKAVKATKPATKAKPKATSKVTKIKAIVAKVAKPKLADGLVFYRADRNKWVAITNGGKQECARPTAEACVAWMFKKYPTLKANIRAKA